MPNRARAFLYGTVASDPTNRVTTNGKTELTIKLSVQTTKQSTNQKYPNENDFYEVRVYGSMAERLLPVIKKGTKLNAIGALQMGKPWTDQGGATHVTPVVFATDIDVTSGGNWNNNQQENEDVVPGL